MNEYQDQDVWWEVFHYTFNGWECVADRDSREEAEELVKEFKNEFSDDSFRIKRVCGQA